MLMRLDKRAGVLVLVAVALVMSAVAIVALFRRPRDDAWRSKLDSLPRFEKISSYSDSYNRTVNHVANEVARLSNWTMDEAVLLTEIIKRPFPAPVPDQMPSTLEDIETELIFNIVMGTISERFIVGAPIDDDAKELLTTSLLDCLSDQVWKKRLAATTCLVQAGFAEDPMIRRRIEALTSDPSAVVATNASRQLTHFDLIRKSPRGE